MAMLQPLLPPLPHQPSDLESAMVLNEASHLQADLDPMAMVKLHRMLLRPTPLEPRLQQQQDHLEQSLRRSFPPCFQGLNLAMSR